jgi:N-acetylneuraminic acid mutarotase
MARRHLNVFTFESMEPRRLLAATTVRIDVGGDGHVEASGKGWAPDRGFTAGTAVGGSGAVSGTTEDALFDSRRFGNFSYSLPIKSGNYRVKLLFIDPTHSTAGQRTFDVFAEKKLILNNFDIAAAAGERNAAIVKTKLVTVSDGRLNLWFQNVKDNAIVSAIEVTRATPSIGWTDVASAPLPRFEALGEVVNDKLYVFGGFKNDDIKTTARSHAFDAASGQWSEIAPVPVPLTHAGSAVDGQFIYLAGGFVGDWKGASTPTSRKIYRYNTTTNTWSSILQLPQPRGAGALVRVGRKLHFFGGLDQNFTDRGEHWTLDLRNPTVWRTDTPMPHPRNHLGYALMGTKIYAIGGQQRLDEDGGNIADVHAFDVISGQWSQVASLPQPRSHTHNSTIVIAGKRLVIVGGSTNGPQTLTDLLEYDPLGNKWSFIGNMPGARSAAVAKMLGDHIMVTGGTTADISPKTDSWISQ